MCSADLNDSRCECDRPILAPEAEARRPLVVVVVRIRLWFRFREYRGRQMQFILVKRHALPPPRGDQGPSHPTQNVTKALFGLILWRNDGWIPFLLRTLLHMSLRRIRNVYALLRAHSPCLLILRCAYTNIEVCHPVLHKGQCSAALNRNRFSVFSALCFRI